MEKEIFSGSKPVQFIDSEGIVAEGTVYSSWVDTLGYESFVAAVDLEGTKGQVTSLVIQAAELTDQSDAVTVSNDFLLYQPGKFPAVAGAAQFLYIGSVSKPRYFRVGFVININGGSVALKLVGGGLLSNAKSKPPEVNSSVLTTAQINAPSTEGDTKVTAPKRTS